MPVFNEEKIIEKSVRGFYGKVLINFIDWEFIVVNDCSTDKTSKALNDLKKEISLTIINNKENLGHGPSLLKGLHCAKGDYVFHADSDYQIPPEAFWGLYKDINTSDYILGCRSRRKDPINRLIISNILRSIIFLFFNLKIKDINSPFKLMKAGMLKEALKTIPNDFLMPSVALGIFAKRNHYHFRETEVAHLPRLYGKSTILRLKLVKFCIISFIQLIGFQSKL